MTSKERFLETMRFGSPDRIPYRFGHPRKATMSAWYYQGLKRNVNLTQTMEYDDWRGLPIDLLPCWFHRGLARGDRGA